MKAADPTSPLYRQLFDQYRDDILAFRLQPGQRIDSIAEMVRKHQVARETAKRVLNLLAAEGYIIQLPGKGSFVADLRPKQKIWGLVFPFFSVQYEDLIREVTARAEASGRELRHFCDYNHWEDEVRLVGMMVKERYEAVVVIPTLDESRTWEFYSRLSPFDTPVILLDHTMSLHDFPYVVQSYDLGVVRALSYLLDRKPGGVAFIENEIWAGRNMVLEVMRETYLGMVRQRCPDFDPLILPRANAVEAHDLRRQGVTGIFCCDDICAIQAIGRLKEQGAAVPEEFGVVSYGNTDIGRYFTPPITSVDPHNAEMADEVARILQSNGSPDGLAQHVVQPELIVRGT
jgi:DNA-binding LacI/PurR family transcriptional regulator